MKRRERLYDGRMMLSHYFFSILYTALFYFTKYKIIQFQQLQIYFFLNRDKSNRKAMNRNWSNQKANPALKTKARNK